MLLGRGAFWAFGEGGWCSFLVLLHLSARPGAMSRFLLSFPLSDLK